MESDIKVSIITVAYNSAGTIARTIESVVNQTYNNIEYIIIDGDSSDGTIDIINKNACANPSLIRWISEPDNGIYDAMNKGIKLATGDIIGIINSDDWYEGDAVENIIQAYIHMSKPELCVFYGGLLIWDNGVPVDDVLYENHCTLETNMIPHPTCFVTRKCYEQLGVFDLNYKSVADYDLMLRYYYSKRVEFKNIHKHIANFCYGGMSASLQAAFELYDMRLKYGLMSRHEVKVLKAKDIISSWLYRIGIDSRNWGKLIK